jgi:CRP-like cAMP-binding protein
MLQTVGVKLLKAMCEHLEPVDYPEDWCFFREEDRLNKMIFITRGTAQTYMTNRKGGKIGSQFLEVGDYYGADELLTWASKFCSFDTLPTSMRMVKAVTKVEAFELSADDLKRVAIKYWWHFTKNKKLIDISHSKLEKFAQASIKKEVRRRKAVKSLKQAKEKQTIKSEEIG